MIDGLKALRPVLDEYIVKEIEARRLRPGGDPVTGLGLKRAAMMRGALFFRANISGDDADVDGAGTTFATAWMIAERETFKRIVTAITSPAAKGREAEVVAALMRGASIEDALRSGSADAGSSAYPDKRMTVLPFRMNGGPR